MNAARTCGTSPSALRRGRALTIVTLAVALVLPAAGARAHEGGIADAVLKGLTNDTFGKAMHLMTNELVGEAAALVDELAQAEPGSARTLLAQARLSYLRNRFDEALETLNQARNAPGGEELLAKWRGLEDLVLSTWQTTRDMKGHPTSRGHFVIYVIPGVDEVLLPYADQALEAAYDAYGDLFGYRPSEPVPVHVYPRVEALASVSLLKVSEIQTSGTIALCKYNRLMITSPRDLVWGYDWLDTLAHEYIHYVIIKHSRNTVPIWLHEGLAKFFENRWRDKADAVLAPPSQDILVRALEAQQLVTFEQMSPSMAKLPSQETTALAFAEVFTVMQFLKGRVGMSGIGKLIGLMRDGRTDRQAIEAVLDTSFSRFEEDWRRALGAMGLARLPAGHTQRLLFKNKDSKDDELKDIGAEKAEELTYLGDLLRVRKRHLAASKEYRKAASLVPVSPVIQYKLGATLLQLGKPDDALSELLPPLKLYPDYHVLLYLYAGQAYLTKGDHRNAAQYLEKALQLNPFDPDIHTGLVTVYDALGRGAEAERERAALKLLEANRQ